MKKDSDKFALLTPAQKAMSPFGSNRCPLCRLPIEQLIEVHRLAYEQKQTRKETLEHVRSVCGISPSFNQICDHLNKHAAQSAAEHMSKEKVYEHVASALQLLPKEAKEMSMSDVATAYQSLTKMVGDMAQQLEKMYNLIDFNNDEKIKKQLEAYGPIKSMEIIAKLHKESRDQIKDMMNLKAPRVLVQQLLEGALNDFIKETGFIIMDFCRESQLQIMEAAKDGTPVTTDMFAPIYRELALDFQKRILAVKHNNMEKALSTLNNLERII